MSENSVDFALREEALTPLIYSLPAHYSQSRASGHISADKRLVTPVKINNEGEKKEEEFKDMHIEMSRVGVKRGQFYNTN